MQQSFRTHRCAKKSCRTYGWVMTSNARVISMWLCGHDSSICSIRTSHSEHMDVGWLRLVGSLKSLVSFAEYCLFYRALLQKRPVILRSLLGLHFRIRKSHFAHIDESCHAYERVMSNIQMSLAANLNECASFYGVATISRLLNITSLFCKRTL